MVYASPSSVCITPFIASEAPEEKAWQPERYMMPYVVFNIEVQSSNAFDNLRHSREDFLDELRSYSVLATLQPHLLHSK